MLIKVLGILFAIALAVVAGYAFRGKEKKAISAVGADVQAEVGKVEKKL